MSNQEIEAAALSLPEPARLDLINRLLLSVPGEGVASDDHAILQEAEARVVEIDSGAVQLLSEEEFWKRVKAR